MRSAKRFDRRSAESDLCGEIGVKLNEDALGGNPVTLNQVRWVLREAWSDERVSHMARNAKLFGDAMEIFEQQSRGAIGTATALEQILKLVRPTA